MRQKHTKIIATVSPSSGTVDILQQMHDNGMDVVRINTAHATLDGAARLVENVRQVSDRIAILVDTKGPEIRTSSVDNPVELLEGNVVHLKYGTEPSTASVINVSYEHFVDKLHVDDTVIIDDGDIVLSVVHNHGNTLECHVVVGAMLGSFKTVNVPNKSLGLPSLTEQDKKFIAFAAEQDLDFIAHSFVRNKQDCLAVQEYLDSLQSGMKIVAKIENQEGIDNIDEIIDTVYGVMIARGDLGVEIPLEEVPSMQKMIIQKCRSRSRPVIVATQMLESMITKTRPTRAEVSDVANAVFDGADCVMLSGETAKGNHPALAVKTMSEIIRGTEKRLPPGTDESPHSQKNQVRAFLGKAAVLAARELPAKAVIVPTHSGASARVVSSYRVRPVIYAQCFSPQVMRHLRICYGVHSDITTFVNNTDELVDGILNKLVVQDRLHKDDLVIVLGVTPGSVTGASFLEINTVKECCNLQNHGDYD